MLNLRIVLSIAALAVPLAAPVQAMPIQHDLGADAAATLISGGCGPYGHRGPYGGCRPGGGWGGPGWGGPGWRGPGWGGPGWRGRGGGGWHNHYSFHTHYHYGHRR
ncbi:GCG_CRPN prefix-to-repeats domain-containing protein [Lichenihabitans psoromatis]|uniref:GCG_CRPN prefix-to-repeats domain-containing protein n=1 Tax=Lichenihabitans psoromatis TaxID=2528642 RepID=UPI0013F15B87|nr:hypothetical protein [Lichenihabitans psoromatis]